MVSTLLPLNHAVIEVMPHGVKNESSPTWSFPYGRTFWKVLFFIKCISGLSTNTEWSPDREHLVRIGAARLTYVCCMAYLLLLLSPFTSQMPVSEAHVPSPLIIS